MWTALPAWLSLIPCPILGSTLLCGALGTQVTVCPHSLAMADGVPLICDYGSALSKVGFAGKEAPQAVFPTILGKLRHDVSGSCSPCAVPQGG